MGGGLLSNVLFFSAALAVYSRLGLAGERSSERGIRKAQG